jgi:pimeloyl-ACP methyl ester carboxylesterase
MLWLWIPGSLVALALKVTLHTDRESRMPITHRFVDTNGIRMHIAEAGSGPLVLFCHGWPESWYSWRHQLEAVAAAGFHAVAPDMRGYGQTDRPEAIDQYSIMHLAGDMVGVLDALKQDTAVIVSHDWGATVAWQSVLFRPDRFRAIAALSVPYRPRATVRPTTVMPKTETHEFYLLYFQTPGRAESELERDPKRTIALTMLGASPTPGAITPSSPGPGMVSRVGGWLGDRRMPDKFPDWLTEADIDFYAGEFERAGFRGGLNWYRNIDRNRELMAPFAGAKVEVPALFMTGDKDLVYRSPGVEQLVANLAQFVPKLKKTVILPGCGHWTQEERKDDVNRELVAFLKGL